MASDNANSPDLFANKGRARPASGLKSVYLNIAHDAADAPGETPLAPPKTSYLVVGDGELEDAASLQIGGFKTAPRTTAAAKEEPAVAPPVTPQQIDTAIDAAATPGAAVTAAEADPQDFTRPLIVGLAFVGLLLLSLGIGLAISALTRGDENAGAAVKSLPPNAGPAASGQSAIFEQGIVVQVASLPDPGAAVAFARSIATAHADLFGDKSLDIQETQRGADMFHQVRVGPFESADAARSFCAQLQTRGNDCLVVEN